MFVSCVHPVAVLNAAFCKSCSLLKLIEDARGNHMEETYSRAGLMTALYRGYISIYHHECFYICSGLCACT